MFLGYPFQPLLISDPEDVGPLRDRDGRPYEEESLRIVSTRLLVSMITRDGESVTTFVYFKRRKFPLIPLLGVTTFKDPSCSERFVLVPVVRRN